MDTLSHSTETLILAFVPAVDEGTDFDMGLIEEVMLDVLDGENYGLHEETGIFCVCRDNLWSPYGDDRPISVYKIPDGYMLQFNHQYRFVPSEMEAG